MSNKIILFFFLLFFFLNGRAEHIIISENNAADYYEKIFLQIKQKYLKYFEDSLNGCDDIRAIRTNGKIHLCKWNSYTKNYEKDTVFNAAQIAGLEFTFYQNKISDDLFEIKKVHLMYFTSIKKAVTLGNHKRKVNEPESISMLDADKFFKLLTDEEKFLIQIYVNHKILYSKKIIFQYTLMNEKSAAEYGKFILFTLNIRLRNYALNGRFDVFNDNDCKNMIKHDSLQTIIDSGLSATFDEHLIPCSNIAENILVFNYKIGENEKLNLFSVAPTLCRTNKDDKNYIYILCWENYNDIVNATYDFERKFLHNLVEK